MKVGDIVYIPEGIRGVVTGRTYDKVRVRFSRGQRSGYDEELFLEERLERAESAAERFKTSLEIIAKSSTDDAEQLRKEAAATLGMSYV